ncbi:MAG TPA: mechanosensitive ion channel family protein [candidate division WOR-3 bacterium]|uniref:Mechanosensitive ion channel family protein n=1 Tax=candidate division WOR-3 bacterium TaxID=2052148 RepID=A0A9C9JZA8_UNCW3|nr:mechanosensitive ion channel family protein [candidate division WOR-3 bacterium]
MGEWLKLHALKIIITVVIGLVVYLILQNIIPRFVHRTISLRMKNKEKIEIEKRSRTLSRVLTGTAGLLICLVVLFTILAEIGINIAPALASLGIIGVAVGFGAQSLIKDFINGLFILMENQYGIGDVVKIAGISGLVEEVNLRRTILRDLDGVVHYIPNGVINTVSNMTKEFSRVNMNISVAYREDLDHVIEVINRVCAEMAEEPIWKGRIKKPPQVLRVDALGDSGIEIKILGETAPSAQWDIMGELRKRIKREFDREGIEIPWPHMKVIVTGTPIKGA